MHPQTPVSTLHVICPFSSWSSEGGAWWHALDIYQRAGGAGNALLWSEHKPAAALSAYPIRTIAPFRGQAPHGGTLIFVGMSMMPGGWYEHACPERVVVVCTMFAPQRLYRLVHRLALGGKVKVEVSYASEMLQRLCALPGRVEPPTFGLEPFLSTERHSMPRPFTVGRVSRDSLMKHHFRDPGFYRTLVQSGCRVRVVGGTCLAPHVPRLEGIELLSEQPRAALPIFLASLDCFFYRTPLHCPEGLGLVVLEAMAAGLPVLCHRSGGYADLITHERNGLLFERDEQAREWIMVLRQSPDFARQLAEAARNTVRALLSS